MRLNTPQISRLAQLFDKVWNLTALSVFVSDNLSIKLENIVYEGTLENRAKILINALNNERPPRVEELLEALRGCANRKLREIADEMLNQHQSAFFSPTGDPRDAIILGRAAFVDRDDLRKKLRDFTHPNPNSTRVLIIRGAEPCGKSYSWWYLSHLANMSASAKPELLELRNKSYTSTPKQFFETIFRRLGMNVAELPPMTDEPQLARIDALINAFTGQLVNLQRPYWLVIDDLNHPTVPPHIRDAAYAIAYSVELSKPENLWIVLLGYNEEITDNALRWVAQDDARFPDAVRLAKHLQLMAGPEQFPLEDAREYASLLLSKFEKLDKAAMEELTRLIETMGEKLRLGERM